GGDGTNKTSATVNNSQSAFAILAGVDDIIVNAIAINPLTGAHIPLGNLDPYTTEDGKTYYDIEIGDLASIIEGGDIIEHQMGSDVITGGDGDDILFGDSIVLPDSGGKQVATQGDLYDYVAEAMGI